MKGRIQIYISNIVLIAKDSCTKIRKKSSSNVARMICRSQNVILEGMRRLKYVVDCISLVDKFSNSKIGRTL